MVKLGITARGWQLGSLEGPSSSLCEHHPEDGASGSVVYAGQSEKPDRKEDQGASFAIEASKRVPVRLRELEVHFPSLGFAFINSQRKKLSSAES